MARLGGSNGSSSGDDAVTRAPEPAAVVPPPQPLGRQLMSDGAAEYYDLTPDLAGRADNETPWPKVIPQPAFWLVYVPDRWDVLEGQLVPMLYKLSLNPGANGMIRGQGGRVDPSDAIAQVERQGHYRLDWRIDGGNYLRAFQVGVAQDRRTGAPVKVYSWHTRFETLYAGSEHIQTDGLGYAKWLAELIAAGKLPRPRPYVVERLVRFYETRLHKALSKGGSPEIASEYKRRLGIVLAEQARQSTPHGPPVAPVEVEPDLEVQDPPVDDLEPTPPPRRGRSER